MMSKLEKVQTAIVDALEGSRVRFLVVLVEEGENGEQLQVCSDLSPPELGSVLDDVLACLKREEGE